MRGRKSDVMRLILVSGAKLDLAGCLKPSIFERGPSGDWRNGAP
jgi:hypothetical protein